MRNTKGDKYKVLGNSVFAKTASRSGTGQRICVCVVGKRFLSMSLSSYPEIKLPTSVGSLEKQESSRKISTSALLTSEGQGRLACCSHGVTNDLVTEQQAANKHFYMNCS